MVDLSKGEVGVGKDASLLEKTKVVNTLKGEAFG
jgi:hypothetical protein